MKGLYFLSIKKRCNVLKSVEGGITLSLPSVSIGLDEAPFFTREAQRQGYRLHILSSQPDVINDGDTKAGVNRQNGIKVEDGSLKGDQKASDMSLVRRALYWEPKVSFEKGIERFLPRYTNR